MEKTWRKSSVHITDTAVTADASANQKDIVVSTNTPTDDFVYNINIKRARVDVTNNAIHFYNPNSGTVVIRDNSTDYVITAGDVITISGTYL
jgi:ABC-type Zn uptake system ZnuABC Zn-binding protein ZnuA